MIRDLTIDQIISGMKLHDTTVLAKTITLLESEKSEHRELSVKLLATLGKNKPKTTAFKIAISGTPGVGKSSFIEKFGLYLIDKLQAKVAVLTIDPSSQISGGSILGDKTRMNELSRRDGA